MEQKKHFGLALSGGGVRALVFHLGILERFAIGRLLENITQLSTVSGGSLSVGLIYKLNGYKWPESKHYLDTILPKAETILTTTNLQKRLILLSILQGRLLKPRGNLLAYCIGKTWGIKEKIGNLPEKPQWWINSTCYETGKNWRFSKKYIGDYIYGRSKDNSSFFINKALAASAAFPGLIGPVVFKPDWGSKKKIHLWDGGVYDNLGMEVLFKPGDGYQKKLNYLFISDAGQKLETEKRINIKSPLRLIEIATSQVRSLRARIIVDYLKNNQNKGCYFQIGNTVEKILNAAEVKIDSNWIKKCLNENEVQKVATFPTTLKKLKPSDFTLIRRHGFEVANATLHGYLKYPYKNFIN